MIDFYTSYKVNITGQYSYRTDFDEFEILASPKTLLEILSKGENK